MSNDLFSQLGRELFCVHFMYARTIAQSCGVRVSIYTSDLALRNKPTEIVTGGFRVVKLSPTEYGLYSKTLAILTIGQCLSLGQEFGRLTCDGIQLWLDA